MFNKQWQKDKLFMSKQQPITVIIPIVIGVSNAGMCIYFDENQHFWH
jgi:hypothetical protein